MFSFGGFYTKLQRQVGVKVLSKSWSVVCLYNNCDWAPASNGAVLSNACVSADSEVKA